MNRRGKIVCTLGPATSTDETLRALVEAGMDVWRRRCWRGSASRRSSNGETVHFKPPEIQRHQDAGFTLSQIKVTEPEETN